MSGGVSLWFAHGTRNVGDVALNTGAVALLATAGASVDVAMLPPMRGANLDAARASMPETVRTTVVSPETLTLDVLDEFVAHPERLFRSYGVDHLETVLLHAGEHVYAPADLATVHPLALWRLLPGLAAAATGRRLIVLPSTFGPFAHRPYSRIAGSMVRAATAIAARDAVSARTIEPFRRSSVAAHLDPAFFVRPPAPLATHAGRVAISMRLEGYGLRAGSAESERALREHQESGFRSSTAFRAARAAIELCHGDPTVSSITLIAQTSSDLPLMQALHDSLPDPQAVDLVDVHRATPRDAQRVLASHDLLLTSRFHGSVLALAAGTPAGGLPLVGHGHKIPGLYESLGEPGWAVAADRVDNRQELRALMDSLREPDRSVRVAETLDRAREQTSAWIDTALAAPIIDARASARRALRHLSTLARARQAVLARG
jgi:polysaccharide pyruvyl transferase WcaK-like protein